MLRGETRTGKASIKVKLKQDADKASESLVLEGASKNHLIFPRCKTGLMVCIMSATEALEFGQTSRSWTPALTLACHAMR